MEPVSTQKKLKTFGPEEFLTENGFACVRHGRHVYPPFYNLNVTLKLSQTWDTQPNDIFICTHQKVGTHLTKKYVAEIVRSVVTLSDGHPLADGDIGHGAIPWPEVLVSQHGEADFQAFLEKTEGTPRIWYLHNYSDDLPFRSIHPGSRFIYTLRDPRGAAVSQYFFYKGHPNLQVSPDLTMTDFISYFLEGKLYFGDYHQHVLDWIGGCHGRINQAQLLVLRYEDLVTDKMVSVEKIGRFLAPGSAISQASLAAIAGTTEFETMKQHLTDKPGTFHFNPATFFRAGTTDDWQQHLTASQESAINAKTRARWGDASLSCPGLYQDR